MPKNNKSALNYLLSVSTLVLIGVLLLTALYGRKVKTALALKKIAHGFTRPLQVVFPPGDAHSMYVVEQKGRIYRISGKSKTIFLNITRLVRSMGNEEGLLSMAFSPDYQENKSGSSRGYLYVNYTAGIFSHTVISEFPIKKGLKPVVLTRRERIVLKFPQPYSNHNGGMILFGPDKMLYIGTGDGGSGGDPLNNGQKKNTLLGKILRINPKKYRGQAYSIPKDNPFRTDKSYRSEIYALGMRNPWRFSFDKKTGKLYAGDVGQNKQEEISIIPKGGNMGWRLKEGLLCYDPPKNCHRSGLTDPIHVYNHDDGQSVTGGYVYRGSALSGYERQYFFADYVAGTIWRLPLGSDGQPSSRVQVAFKKAGMISSFGEDQFGELYFTDFVEGAVFKIVPKS